MSSSWLDTLKDVPKSHQQREICCFRLPRQKMEKRVWTLSLYKMWSCTVRLGAWLYLHLGLTCPDRAVSKEIVEGHYFEWLKLFDCEQTSNTNTLLPVVVRQSTSWHFALGSRVRDTHRHPTPPLGRSLLTGASFFLFFYLLLPLSMK